MKKRIIFGTVIIMVLSVIFHNMYKWIPNALVGIFFPVNESIWEHGKMIIMAYIVWLLIEKYVLKDETNVVASIFLSCVICIILDFLIFTPIYLYVLETNDNMVVTIGIYLVCVVVSLIIREYFLRREKNISREYIGILGFVILITVFAILTYHPIELPIFYDFNKEIYGIPLS